MVAGNAARTLAHACPTRHGAHGSRYNTPITHLYIQHNSWAPQLLAQPVQREVHEGLDGFTALALCGSARVGTQLDEAAGGTSEPACRACCLHVLPSWPVHLAPYSSPRPSLYRPLSPNPPANRKPSLRLHLTHLPEMLLPIHGSLRYTALPPEQLGSSSTTTLAEAWDHQRRGEAGELLGGA